VYVLDELRNAWWRYGATRHRLYGGAAPVTPPAVGRGRRESNRAPRQEGNRAPRLKLGSRKNKPLARLFRSIGGWFRGLGDEDELAAPGCQSCVVETIPLAVQAQKRQQAFNATDAMLEFD
jgi:hypothetical protein